MEEKYVSQIEGAKFQEEAYHLTVTGKRIILEATTPKGMYWGKQTLEQLKYTKNKKTYLPQCEITDWPAFRIRGFMHDVGRSYIPVEELKREISLLSRYKSMFSIGISQKTRHGDWNARNIRSSMPLRTWSARKESIIH